MKRATKTRKGNTNGIPTARPASAPSTERPSKGPSRDAPVKWACSKLGLFTQEELDVGLSRYDIGAEVNELRAAEATHGDGLVAEVGDGIGRDADSRYNYGQGAALSTTLEEVEEIRAKCVVVLARLRALRTNEGPMRSAAE